MSDLYAVVVCCNNDVHTRTYASDDAAWRVAALVLLDEVDHYPEVARVRDEVCGLVEVGHYQRAVACWNAATRATSGRRGLTVEVVVRPETGVPSSGALAAMAHRLARPRGHE